MEKETYQKVREKVKKASAGNEKVEEVEKKTSSDEELDQRLLTELEKILEEADKKRQMHEKITTKQQTSKDFRKEDEEKVSIRTLAAFLDYVQKLKL